MKLDPTNPFVLDTRDLRRGAGNQKQIGRTVQAPADLGSGVMNVPEGSDIILELRLEAVMDGVLLSGTASVELDGECARCLQEIRDELDVDLTEFYLYEEPQDPNEDADELVLEDDMIDLDLVLRDAVVGAIPFQPLCTDDCPGLCPDCGARLADEPDHNHDAKIDPRWAGLGGLELGDDAT
ncbi:hypothetical protein Back2_24780 [Nocardioides baekrokdamisoli]|uniref:Metal-binding protein n=1 Tax=Nocardioides baekrokdamisoli TaxID=1804624 RepID=A0A3G9IWY2_9ACTN|nr:DUF177 domain-containing protein [Nocardioides baekrokdamisoli]BBH18191.1 hypothetical protein Back2_24780 [Nocardioides baekrokdamisoli]